MLSSLRASLDLQAGIRMQLSVHVPNMLPQGPKMGTNTGTGMTCRITTAS